MSTKTYTHAEAAAYILATYGLRVSVETWDTEDGHSDEYTTETEMEMAVDMLRAQIDADHANWNKTVTCVTPDEEPYIELTWEPLEVRCLSVVHGFAEQGSYTVLSRHNTKEAAVTACVAARKHEVELDREAHDDLAEPGATFDEAACVVDAAARYIIVDLADDQFVEV